MSYYLGIDIGASRVHAAIARTSPSGDEVVESFALGEAGLEMPAVMSVTADGELVFGEAAAARGGEHNGSLVNGIRHRVGTGVPFLVSGQRVCAEDAYARLAAEVVARVQDSEGQPADHVVLTHPASWGTHRIDLIRTALATHCGEAVDLLPEPQAAALGHILAADPGQLVAVCDLGATTLKTAILRTGADGMGTSTLANDAVAIGGLDLDDVVLESVLASTPTLTHVSHATLAALRTESSGAKEALSSQAEVTIPTRGSDGPLSVRLTRSQFEVLIQGLLDRTVAALKETIDSSGVAFDDVSTVVLAGGSARIPFVAEHLTTALARPVVADHDPGAVIAMGAARSGLLSVRPDDLSDQTSTSSDEFPDHDDDPDASHDALAALMHFIPEHRTRAATAVWRILLAVLILASAAYLVWSLNSDTSGLFGSAPDAGSVFDPVGGR